MAAPKGLMIAMLGKSKSPKPAADDAADSDDGGDFESAASAMFDAIKEDDLDAFKSALKLAVMSCGDDYES